MSLKPCWSRWLIKLVFATLSFTFTNIVAAETTAGTAVVDPAIKEVTIDASQFSRGDALPSWVDKVEIPATQKHNPTVIRLADTEFMVGPIKQVYVNRVLQINDNASLGQAGQIPIYFNPAYEKLNLHLVRIFRGEEMIDQTAKVSVRFLQREQGLENGVYDGAITAMLLLSDLRVGDSVQYTYSTQGANPVFEGQFNDLASWDQQQPVELRHVKISFPAQRNIQWRLIGDLQDLTVTPQTTVENGLKTLRFEAKNLKNVDYELYTPLQYIPFRTLQFSEYSSWQQVATWGNGLFPKPKTLPAELQTLLANARKLPNDEARALYLLQWVQSEIRYFSLSLGESSHRPYAPADVVARRFGDCKDKTYLLVTLLKELGIDAKPALLSVQSHRISKQYLPTPGLFDHVIVYAKMNGKAYYLDGTKLPQVGQLSNIETGLEGADALIVADNTTGFSTIHHDNINVLRIDMVEDHISLGKLEGDATLETTHTWRSSNAEAARVGFAQLTPEQLNKYAQSLFERRYPDIELIGEPQLIDDKTQNIFIFKAKYKVPKIATESDGDWVVHYQPSVLEGVLQTPNTFKRNLPMAMVSYPYQGIYNLSMDWPENISARLDPFTEQVSSSAFKAEFSHSFRGNSQKINIRFTALDSEVKVADLAQYAKDSNRISKLITGVIVANREFVQTTNKSVGKSSGKKILAESLKEKEQERIIKLTKTIDGGKLSGDDLANVYCERAFALSNINESARGLKDAEEAIKISPNNASIIACRGELQLNNQHYVESLKDLNEALNLGEPPNSIYHLRGRLKFFQGKYASAADDYAKIQSDGGDSNLYAVMRRMIMLQKTKTPLPSELTKIAQEIAQNQPLGDWPRPAVSMLAGLTTPEQVLAEINKKSGDDKELALAEGWFYIGEYYLQLGKQELAVSAFKKVCEKNITMYEEHLMAAHELKQLGIK